MNLKTSSAFEDLDSMISTTRNPESRVSCTQELMKVSNQTFFSTAC